MKYSGNTSKLHLVRSPPCDQEGWSTITLFQVMDHAQNHLGCTLADEREATDPLSRGELYSLLSLIQQGLDRSRSAENIPVSYINMDLRV